MQERIPVAVLGATGTVGQRFVRRLAGHPLFSLHCLAASERSERKRYREACEWRLDGEAYAGLGDMVLQPVTPEACRCPVVFSALDTAVAREVEPRFAAAGSFVFSNAAAFRMEEDVPLLVPEVNPEHLALVKRQQQVRGWRGAIVTNPNCTTTVLVMALAPLHRAFGVEAVLVTSMQAVSGAGYPGVPSLDIIGNIVPHIRGEEEKVEEETPKLLGAFGPLGIRPADVTVSALCHRVPVLDGHTEAVSVRLRGNPGPAEVARALDQWRARPQELGLPTAPGRPVHVTEAPDRPQVRRDVEKDQGMAVHVGRIRPCPILGLKFSLLGHNTERGAAGGSLLNAELALAEGVLTVL